MIRLRPPSAGFVYLGLTVAATVGFFAYLAAPPWFERPEGRERALAEAAYLHRIATDARGGASAGWRLNALMLYLQHGAWGEGVRLIRETEAAGASFAGIELASISPGRCWAMGLAADHKSMPAGVAYFVLHNPDHRAHRFTLRWSGPQPGAIGARPFGGEWRRHALSASAPHVVDVDHSLDAGATLVLEVLVQPPLTGVSFDGVAEAAQ